MQSQKLMRKTIARIVRAPLRALGFELVRLGVAPSWPFTVDLLKRHRLAPRTVFDIGVADGTPWLYETFPHAEYHLIDPTRESLPHMQEIAGRLKATVHNVALGESNGTLPMILRKEIGGASMFEEIGQADVINRHDVPVRRFDQLFTHFARPALVKIDVQGAEIMVLRGMGERLHDLDAIIVETSTIATIHDAPEVADVLCWLSEHGWALFDIIGAKRRPLDRALAQIDAVFMPVASPTRADKRWQGS